MGLSLPCKSSRPPLQPAPQVGGAPKLGVVVVWVLLWGSASTLLPLLAAGFVGVGSAGDVAWCQGTLAGLLMHPAVWPPSPERYPIASG